MDVVNSNVYTLCSEVYTENAFTSCKQFQGIFDSQIDTAQKNISHPSMILKEVKIRFVAWMDHFDLRDRITVSIGWKHRK